MNIPNVMLNGVKHLSKGYPSLALRMTRRGADDDRGGAQDDRERSWGG